MSEIKVDTLFQKVEGLVARDIVGETLIVPFKGDLADMECLFSLNSVGSFVWNHLDGATDFSAMTRLLFDRYEAEPLQVEHDLRELLMDLAEKSLIKEVT